MRYIRQRVKLDEKDSWHTDICQGITMAYFLVMALIYPIYAPGGYMRIGDVKYKLFWYVSLTTFAVMAVVILAAVLIAAVCGSSGRRLVSFYRQMSVTDWFAYGYFVAVMLSYLCSDYKETALRGADGWYMGAAVQMIFVLLYFLFSRYFHEKRGWIGVWLVVSAAVFLLGICNRYSVYPIAMEGQTDTFISTLGNINWFCGYWSVAASVGIAWYWCSDRGWIRLLTGIYSAIAMLCGVTQGSNSAYLVFGALGVGLLLLSVGNHHKMYRFLELCMMFGAVCQLGRLLRYMPGLAYNYGLEPGDGGSRITAALLDSNATLWGLIVAGLCYGALRGLDRYRHFSMEKYRRTIAMTAGTAVALCCAATVVLFFRTGIVHVQDISETEGDFRLVFNEDWGNGRGVAWNCGMDAYREMDILHKLVGVGPDCFADYVYDVPELAEKLADRFMNMRLTNAHNEQITQLVNVGTLGWLCYIGIFLSAFVRWLRRADRQPILYVCAMSVLAYTAHGLVSFQQVLNTPYIFMVLGIGERFYRSAVCEKQEKKPVGQDGRTQTQSEDL